VLAGGDFAFGFVLAVGLPFDVSSITFPLCFE